MISIILLWVLIFPASSMAGVIFSENYDSIQPGSRLPNVWTCADPVPPGWTSKAGCNEDTVNGVTHYCGEVSPGGRTGNSLKLWRRNGGWRNYCGFLNRNLTEEEFNQHYKEFFFRFYMKIPSQWDANLRGGNTHKLNRIVIGKSYGGGGSTFYFDVKGASFKNGKFSFYCGKEGPVRYTSKTLTELGIIDDQWHCYELHFKMNSAIGVADGELHFFIDGKEIEFYTPYGPKHPKGLSKWNFKYSSDEYILTLPGPAIGNISGEWNFPTDKWYAIEFDDFVVSTTYIGPVVK
jgi:hypothetical protein